MKSKIQEAKNICILRLSAMGDVVLMLPVVRTLQTAMPEAKLTWIISETFYPLVEHLKNINFIVIQKPSSLGGYFKLWRQLRKYRFDVLLAMQANLRVNLIIPLIKARVKIGFDTARANDLHRLFINKQIEAGHDHLLDGFLRFTHALGIHEKVIEWPLQFGESERAWLRNNLPQGRTLAINLSASKKERSWMLERYIDVIDVMSQSSVNIVLIGGSSHKEKELAEQLVESSPHTLTNLVGQTGLTHLVAVIKSADVLLSPDSGPVHIATAVGTPVVGLYAVAPTEITGPYSANEFCIDKYSEAVSMLLEKDPSELPWGTRVHHQEAMKLITVEDVLSQLSHLFEHKKAANE